MSNPIIIEHSDREHSDHGASVISRLAACPGSLKASEGIERKTNAAAEEGTAAHELAERCLREGCSAWEYLSLDIHEHEVTEKMAAGVQKYLDECRLYMVDGWEWWIETHVRLDLLNPPVPMYGTTDFAAYNKVEKRLVIVDYKNGYIPVEIKDNMQLRYYALGTYLALPMGYDVNEIEMVVVQPNDYRHPGPKRDYTTLVDLIDFGQYLLDVCYATLKPNAPLHAGKHCKWCPKTGNCEAQVREIVDTLEMDFASFIEPIKDTEVTSLECIDNLRVFTLEEIETIVVKAPFIKQVLDDMEKLLKSMQETGTYKGKLTEVIDTEGNRTWTKEHSPDFIAGLLTQGDFAIPKDKCYTKPKLASPAQIESAFVAEQVIKGAKKKHAEETFKKLCETSGLVYRPPGKKLVPIDKNRKPSKSLADSAYGFPFIPLEEIK